MNDQSLSPIAPVPPPAEIVHPAQAEVGIRYHKAILDVMRRGKTELREQVKVLRKVVEYAVQGADLIDDMRKRGDLAEQGGDRKSKSEVRTLILGQDGLPSRQRTAEWRSLRDHGALAFIDAALESERVAMFEKASVNWIQQRLERIGRESTAKNAGMPAYDYEIRHGDLRTALDDLAGQVDVIVTDPPYPAEFLDEYDALSEVAARILKPDGMLVAMVGHTFLPEYLRRLSLHLSYRWCGAYLMDGPAARVFVRSVAYKWKPLLIFDRGDNDIRRFLTQDVFRSDAADKAMERQIDGWSQSESGMADIIQRTTESGQLVVDPFLGAGTTGVACHALGRRFVGCDIDADAVLAARKRLASEVPI